MENKYNVLVTYKGDGDFRFKIRRIGEVIISADKPIFLYNADIETIGDLRQLKRLLVDITIGAKPLGAFKSYDLGALSMVEKVQLRSAGIKAAQNTLSNNEISNILGSANNGPIELPVEEPVVEEVIEEEPIKEEIVEEPVVEEKPVAKKKSSKKKSNKKK